MRTTGALLIASTLLLGSACEDADKDDDDDSSATSRSGGALLGGVALGNTLLLVQPDEDQAILVEADASSAAATDVERVDLAPNPVWLSAREGDGGEALVLSEGRRGVGEPAVLTALNASGEARSYQVGAPFNAVAQDEDGRFAVLYFQQGADSVVFSPNELALVDLTGSDVTRRTLATAGSTPTGVVVSPRLSISEERRVQVAVVMSRAHVTLLDLDNPDRPGITVQLTQATDAQGATPTRVAFSPRHGVIYVLAEGSDDVFALTLRPLDEGADEEFENTFWPRVTQIAAGQAPTDLLAFGEDEPLLWVASPASGALYRVDVGSGQSEAVDLDAAADGIVGYTGNDDAQRALLYGAGSHEVSFADEASVNAGDDLDTLPLTQPVSRAINLPAQGRVILEHGSSVLSVVDVWKRSATVLSIHGDLSNAVYDEDLGSVWVGRPGDNLVGVVPLSGGAASEVLVQRTIGSLVTLPQAGRVAVLHDSPEASVTFLDAADPNFADAITVEELP